MTPHPLRIYLAGSWKNQQEILLIRDILKSQGHEIDCFASEENGRISFCWAKLEDIQDKLPSMDAKDMLGVQRVQEAFKEDKKWLDWCDLCLLTLPSGKSAHLEAGYAKGQGKSVVIFGDLQKGDFDVMYGFADAIFRSDEIDQMVDFVKGCASHSASSQRIEQVIKMLEQWKRGEMVDLTDNTWYAKEYIITEEQLDHFVTCAAHDDCTGCKYSAPEFVCVPRIMANKVRSRPAPASASENIELYVLKVLSDSREEILERLSSPFSPETIREMQEITRKHDAAIAAKEREQAIKELEKLANEEERLKKESKTNEPWMGHAYANSAYLKAIAILREGAK